MKGLLGIFSVLFLYGFFQQSKEQLYHKMIDELVPKSIPFLNIDNVTAQMLILDCRTRKEFEVSHLENAIWVDEQGEASPKYQLEKLTMYDTILVYCSVGYRSALFGEKLQNKTDAVVMNLYGGIFEWANAQKPIYRLSEKVNEVHPYSTTWGIWLHAPHLYEVKEKSLTQ